MQRLRFGFQGQEKDDEITGVTGSHLAFKYRVHDARIGRFLSIDPLAKDYPWNSPYAFSENKVINSVELEGLESEVIIYAKGKENDGVFKIVHWDDLKSDYNYGPKGAGIARVSYDKETGGMELLSYTEGAPLKEVWADFTRAGEDEYKSFMRSGKLAIKVAEKAVYNLVDELDFLDPWGNSPPEIGENPDGDFGDDYYPGNNNITLPKETEQQKPLPIVYLDEEGNILMERDVDSASNPTKTPHNDYDMRVDRRGDTVKLNNENGWTKVSK